jgi:RNA polymerase sigma-70 factor (ECF subfamily)
VDEHELLARLRQSDQAAFDALFRAWYPALVRFAAGMLRDRAAAEEVAQEAMVELWRRREQLAEGSARAYLFQTTRNRALNQLRHARVRERGAGRLASSSRAEPSAQLRLEEAEIEQAIRAAVGTLPDRCREVFELSRVHGLRYAEIATTLGISVKTVEAQMGKALRLLRARMTPWVSGEGGRRPS